MKEEFKCIINNKKMQLTNKIWNDLRLNSSWSLGFVTKLIESRSFSTKEEWIDFYYESGEERLNLMKNIPNKFKYALLDPHAKEKMAFQIPSEYRGINLNYGRTKEELAQKGFLLYGALQNNPNRYKSIRLDECVEMVQHRTLKETWNGVVLRENNTVDRLREYLNIEGLSIEKACGEEDCRYAIDYKVYYKGKYVVAIQIKPITYKDDSKRYIRDIMKLNKQIHERYKKETGITTLYIYSSVEGEISNYENVELIKKMISKDNLEIVM